MSAMDDHACSLIIRLKAAGPAGTTAGTGGFGLGRGRARRGARRAFTLIELVLVLAILATFAAVAAPRYGGAVARYRVQAAANRIVADLARAQAEARASSSSRTVEFRTANNGYGIAESRSLNDRNSSYRVSLAAAPYESAILLADFGGDSIVRFDGYGVPDSGGTIVVRSGREKRTITVAPLTGVATVGLTSDGAAETVGHQ